MCSLTTDTEDAARSRLGVSAALDADGLQRREFSLAVNATLFIAEDGKWRLPGVYARSCDTLVANHQVGHLDRDSYLLWFADDLSAHLEKSKPPPSAALQRAKYAIGGQMVVLDGGQPNSWAERVPEAQMFAGLDAGGRHLLLAAFEHASQARAARLLAAYGALSMQFPARWRRLGITDSGRARRGPGAKTHPLAHAMRVATHFGIRTARSL